jgi:hypothetical protein
MPCFHQRARQRPAPPLLIAIAWLVFTTTLIRAHDPGLSALDVSVRDGAISVSLSMAAADLKLLAPRSEDAARKLTELARDAIRMSVDGELLRSVDGGVTPDDGGARIRLSFAIPPSAHRARHLTIASDVPRRLARGHRELLIVDIDGRPGTETLLDARSESITVDLGTAASPSPFVLALRFVGLGVDHILSGYDHLVFLAGLLLAASTFRDLLVALTAFTTAHTVSLALVVVGGLHAPPWLVEPLIAASIVWVGVENLVRERHRTPWALVFGFGLIHGFGFADALLELRFGASAADVALALLSFNAGVEAGQLAAAAAMSPLVRMLMVSPIWQARLLPVCSALIAVAGGYWLIERLL